MLTSTWKLLPGGKASCMSCCSRLHCSAHFKCGLSCDTLSKACYVRAI